MTYKMYLLRKKCKNTQINKNIFKQQKRLPPQKTNLFWLSVKWNPEKKRKKKWQFADKISAIEMNTLVSKTTLSGRLHLPFKGAYGGVGEGRGGKG